MFQIPVCSKQYAVYYAVCTSYCNIDRVSPAQQHSTPPWTVALTWAGVRSETRCWIREPGLRINQAKQRDLRLQKLQTGDMLLDIKPPKPLRPKLGKFLCLLSVVGWDPDKTTTEQILNNIQLSLAFKVADQNCQNGVRQCDGVWRGGSDKWYLAGAHPLTLSSSEVGLPTRKK